MTHEQMWAALLTWAVANRNHARNKGGKFNRVGGALDRVMEKMQELDPTITNEEIYYNGTEFHPHNYGFLPKE